MLEGEDERASTTPRSSFLRRLAIGWTVFACAAVLLAAGFLVRHSQPWEEVRWILSAALIFLPAFGLVHHFRLAAIVAITVQGGNLIASAAVHLLGLAGPSVVGSSMCGLVIAYLAADSFVERVRSGVTPIEAALEAMRNQFMPVFSGLASAVAVAFFVGRVSGLYDARQLISFIVWLLIATMFVLVTVPFAAGRTVYGETFLTRVSRAREWRMTLAYPLSFVAVDRWGLSVSGIWFVFATLSSFGAQPAIAGNVVPSAPWIGAALSILGCSILSVRSWRGAVACFLAQLVVALAGLWTAARLGPFHAGAATVWIEAFSAAFILVAAVGARARSADADEKDDEAVARQRSIEDLAGVAAFATLGCGAAQFALVPFADAVVASATAGAGFVAALIFAPALTTAISWLIPRRRSLAELYGNQ